MSKTLVLKSSIINNSADGGTVIPLAIEDDNGDVRAVNLEEYPNNGKIFISKDYSKIDTSFSEQELFILTTVNENRNHNDMENSNECKFFSMGYYANPLDTNTYLPIITMAMPDIASGRVEKGLPSYIGSKPFFILNNGIVAGPFIAQSEEGTWLVIPVNSLPLSLTDNHIAQFELKKLEVAKLVLRCLIDGYERLFFTSLKKANIITEFKKIDYIPDSALIRVFAKMDYGKSVGNITKVEANKLATIIDSYSKKTKVTSDNDRTKRIKNILGEYIKFDGIGVDIVQEYLSTKAGKEFVENYAAANRQSTLLKLEREHSIRIEKFERDTADVSSRYEAKRQELLQYELDMEKRKKDILVSVEILSAEAKEQEKNTLRDRNNELVEEIERSQGKLVELKGLVGDYTNISDRKTQINKMEWKIDDLRDELNKLEGYVRTQQNLIKSPQANDRFVEFKTIQMLLSGISPETSDLIVKPVVLRKSSIQVIGETRKSYIISLKNSFDHTDGRPYTYDEMANLLLCTLQSYITILAGPPGTGKTSTVNRFADSMGLTSKQKSTIETDNFLSIPVGRGWVSSRDMLGFYNSLKNTYQPSRSGLYQFLKAFSDNTENLNGNEFLNLVLMDEANLSSIEHYWSDFLLMCDTFEATHTIDLGIGGAIAKDRLLLIPSNLRFMATINNDATVESLSNRLIDRAAIITLGNGGDTGQVETQEAILSGAVPYKDLMDAFSVNKGEEEMNLIQEKRLKEVLAILSTGKGAKINFSKRKTNAITRYCYVANQLGFEKVDPLDFAISQHILPSISGHGQGLRERLQSLEETLDEFKYSVSRKIVSSIVETGDEFSDSYSFF